MISLKSIYKFSFYFVITIVFLFGGFLQFFFGLSNTGMTLFLSSVLLFNYLIYAVVNGKVVFNKLILIVLIYIFLIFLSGLINNSHVINIIFYNIFPILPLSIYLFFYINKKTGYLSYPEIFRSVLFIAVIQLPILLIQRYFYEFLIVFNNSNQQIASFDFLFGSFFLKSDHSLGFFLLCTIIAIAFNLGNIRAQINKPTLIIIYLSITLLLAESNISKALLILFLTYLLTVSFYSKLIKYKIVRRITLGIVFVLAVIFIYNIRNIDIITSKVGGTFEKHFTIERSYRFFLEGTAKREQVVIAAIHSLDTKFIGGGPYSYFDIKTGKFQNTIHFSQLIWTYFDLGLMGLITVFFYLFYIVKSLETRNKWFFLFIFSVITIYSFYTTPFSEIGIVFSIFMFFNYYRNA